MLPDKLPVVSITFADDIRLTFLQILSFDRLFECDRLGAFRVVVNDRTPEQAQETKDTLNEWISLPNVLSESMRDKVSIIGWSDIFPSVGKVGKRDQQAIKLGASRIIDDEFYLILDGKNHFVRPSSVFDFFQEGKPKLPLWGTVAGFWERCLIPSVEVMEVDDKFKTTMWPSVTPYIMYTEYAQEVCQFLENKYSLPLPEVFEETGDATEFLMYYAHVAGRHGVENYYNAVQPNRTLFTVGPREPEKVVELINKVREDEVAMFGLHRNRVPNLLPDQIELIKDLWSRHLLRPWESAEWFMGAEGL
ncbi:hypothetical protein JKI95_10015 [Corynebacterium aquatimens]|uniref:DUF6492 family protein n=2 Tax=Corynebacterium TaxID=1716 RepID=UPI0025412D9A|nr:DUF6492 family protein [Corynebacterium aquatimens]QYH19419.1 hypothetical protein JKI95_10015 [Corynebacterium aquatimens]